jgi:hypothetical protein
MKRSYPIIFCLLTANILANAQEIYNSNSIPKDLLRYASAVIRSKEVNVEVKDMDNTLYHIKEVVTVLNKNGDNIAHIVVEHDKINIIKYIRGAVYNEFGQQIQKFSEGDFEDVNVGHDFSLFEDFKVKHYLPAITRYPYTIAYEYELRSKQSLNFDEWKPNRNPGVAVEKSSFTFTCKPDFKIRYKETNLPAKAIVNTNAAGLKVYSWEVNNLKAIKTEPYSPYSGNYLSGVRIAPEKFSYYGYIGNFTDWKGLGKWQYNELVANRQQLPIATVEHVKEITRGIDDPKLKAKKIYEYMQGKTHYISVQVGIGGYQPFLASDVDQQNYGDCKALVNYTQALLKAVNIDSYYCVVEAGEEYKVSMLADFASMEQGNHIILCLPFKNDTTWAECTSQTIPFGYLGGFTDDRTVLACTPEGGKLMHTPKYSADDNLESRKANLAINETGELSGEMSATFKGVDYEERSYLAGEMRDEQVKRLKKIYPINNLNIDEVNFKRYKSVAPQVTENIKLHARDYASVTGGKIYFMLNSFDRCGSPPPQLQTRLNVVFINRGFTEEDEVIYTLPAGYKLEKTPLNYSVKKPFGSFDVSMTAKAGQIVYKRKFQVIDGTYGKDIYQELVDFYQTVYEADEYMVSLVK